MADWKKDPPERVARWDSIGWNFSRVGAATQCNLYVAVDEVGTGKVLREGTQVNVAATLTPAQRAALDEILDLLAAAGLTDLGYVKQ